MNKKKNKQIFATIAVLVICLTGMIGLSADSDESDAYYTTTSVDFKTSNDSSGNIYFYDAAGKNVGYFYGGWSDNWPQAWGFYWGLSMGSEGAKPGVEYAYSLTSELCNSSGFATMGQNIALVNLGGAVTSTGTFSFNFSLTASDGSIVSNSGNTSKSVTVTKTTTTIYNYTSILNFNSNGGSGTPSSMSEVTAVISPGDYYLPIKIPTTVPVKEGYDFLGYSEDSAATSVGYQPGDSISVLGDSSKTLYAVWGGKYTLNFNNNGGSGSPPTENHISVNRTSMEITFPDRVPSMPEYMFAGWATSQGGTAQYQPGESYILQKGTYNLYAVYVEPTKIVTFMPQNGTSPTIQSVTMGTVIPVFPADPVKTGYLFQGWYTDEACKALFDTALLITADITLYAGWVEELVFVTEPSASINVQVVTSAGNTILCSAAGSTNYNTIIWDFGDGTTATGLYVTHAYTQPGDYDVKVTVANSTYSDSASQSVTVHESYADKEGTSWTSIVLVLIAISLGVLFVICFFYFPQPIVLLSLGVGAIACAVLGMIL